jgi:hypothetical protein
MGEMDGSMIPNVFLKQKESTLMLLFFRYLLQKTLPLQIEKFGFFIKPIFEFCLHFFANYMNLFDLINRKYEI